VTVGADDVHFDRLVRDEPAGEADVGRAVLQAGQHLLDRHVSKRTSTPGWLLLYPAMSSGSSVQDSVSGAATRTNPRAAP